MHSNNSNYSSISVKNYFHESMCEYNRLGGIHASFIIYMFQVVSKHPAFRKKNGLRVGFCESTRENFSPASKRNFKKHCRHFPIKNFLDS